MFLNLSRVIVRGAKVLKLSRVFEFSVGFVPSFFRLWALIPMSGRIVIGGVLAVKDRANNPYQVHDDAVPSP